MATDEGNYVVGHDEFEQQAWRHGGGREMTALAKNVARVLVVMGLGPDRAAASDQCESKEPGMLDDGEGGQLAFWMVSCSSCLSSTFVVRFRMAEAGLEWVAELDAYAGAIRTDCNELQSQAAVMQRGLTELEQAQEMVSDGTDAIHYGLVEMGGYVRLTELSPDQRRHMCTQERGNMLASRVMGQHRFLQTIRQQNQGFATGQDTDVDATMEEGEQSESEEDNDAADPIVADGNSGPWTLLVHGIRDELNHALRSGTHVKCRTWCSWCLTI